MTKDTNELLPSAQFEGPVSKSFAIDPSSSHSTHGRTNGPSDYVLAAGAVDRDAPTEAGDSQIGRLRAYVTTLQDEVNEFLTARMKGGQEKDVQDEYEDEDEDAEEEE
ncbi:hypothetical protein OGAPHI_003959 [Ogataea philodendri]|uniref:EKC/KEOPS complex subunit GON7 n=1 Tax=Ogataea philodendri TaxID=1378263 RepID=A0A9P8P645_9ASCO|nr:uncharacterized protein OGAPHI_003959 [Ogataea philodendri]KAH3665771.1 hypothetical protein OGAPHI_003959 [Ogataea philodendri]